MTNIKLRHLLKHGYANLSRQSILYKQNERILNRLATLSNTTNYQTIEFSQKCFFSSSQIVNQKELNQSIEITQHDAQLEFVNGLLSLSLELPARKEKCVFSIKLLNERVADLVENIKNEDKSVEKVIIYNKALSNVEPQEVQARKELEDIKQLVSRLYLQLNVEHYEIEQEQKVLQKLELLKAEIQPMEKVKEDLALRAKKHTNRMIWFGLAAMSVQAGILARLTWFDYSWDIVEPISYFVTYSAVIGVYAYFVLTRKEYDYESASDRIFLRHFHKNAVKNNMDVKRYNELKDAMFSLQSELKRIQEARTKKYQEDNRS